MKGLQLHHQIFIGLIIGTLSGLVGHAYLDQMPWITLFSSYIAVPIGQLFLRLIFIMVLPLMLSALITASAKLGNTHKFGTIAAKSIAYALFLAFCASILSVVIVNTLEPGKGVSSSLIQTNIAELAPIEMSQTSSTLPWTQQAVNLIPQNPFEAITNCINPSKEGSIVSVIFISILVGLTLSRCDQEKIKPMIAFFDATLEMSRYYLASVMKMAPIAVAALIFSNSLQFGFDLIQVLTGYVVSVCLGLSLQLVLVYGLVLRFVTKQKIIDFLKKAKLIIMTAFSTSSSNATLPVAIDVAHQEFHLNKDMSRFVLTLGASANQNGSALYEGITILFLAQLYNVDLSILGQITVIGMSMVASLGTAGVPGGTLPLMIGVLTTLNIPTEGLVLILGVERLLDMSRTVVNSVGDLVIALCVNQSVKDK